jgi:hypothetical protein
VWAGSPSGCGAAFTFGRTLASRVNKLSLDADREVVLDIRLPIAPRAGHRRGVEVAERGRAARHQVVLQQLRLRLAGAGGGADNGPGREHGLSAAHRQTPRATPHPPSHLGGACLSPTGTGPEGCPPPRRRLLPRMTPPPCRRRASGRPGAWSPRSRICASGLGPWGPVPCSSRRSGGRPTRARSPSLSPTTASALRELRVEAGNGLVKTS